MVGDILQPTHLIFILVVALLVLGPKRLPEVGRSLGRGIRDFRGAMSGLDEAVNPSSTPTQQVSPAPVSAPPPPQPIETAVLQAAPSSVVGGTTAEADTVFEAAAPAFDTPAVAAAAPPAPPTPAMEFDMDAAFAAQPAAAADSSPATVQRVGSSGVTNQARAGVGSSRSAAAASSAAEHIGSGLDGPDPADYAD